MFWKTAKTQNHSREANAISKGQTCSLDPKQLPGVELLQELGVEAAGLDGQMVQLSLLVTFGQDVLLNGLLTDKSIDVDLTCLPYTMTPVLSLHIDAQGL